MRSYYQLQNRNSESSKSVRGDPQRMLMMWENVREQPTLKHPNTDSIRLSLNSIRIYSPTFRTEYAKSDDLNNNWDLK